MIYRYLRWIDSAILPFDVTVFSSETIWMISNKIVIKEF